MALLVSESLSNLLHDAGTYIQPGGSRRNSTPQDADQLVVPVPGTFANATIASTSNSLDNTATLKAYVNGMDDQLLLTVGIGDQYSGPGPGTQHVVAGDKVLFHLVAGTGSGTFAAPNLCVEFTPDP